MKEKVIETEATPTLCIFTPTYNRAYILPKLYETLLEQTCSDFMWLIVDDGSNDETEDLMKTWIEAGQIHIDYLKKANGGKPRAINDGVARTNCPLFFVVDSDDHLVPTAVEHILSAWETITDDDSFAGIIALSGTDPNTPLGTWMPEGVRAVKCWDLFETMGFRGDTSLIYRTEILRDYPYDVAEGENFIAESSVYYRLDEKYVLLAVNTILKLCDYLPDGMTKNFAQIAKRNPIGYWKHKQYCAQRATTLKGQVRETILYIVGCKLAGKRQIIADAPRRLLAVACYVPAIVVRHTLFR